jgi:hypothetical protein
MADQTVEPTTMIEYGTMNCPACGATIDLDADGKGPCDCGYVRCEVLQ